MTKIFLSYRRADSSGHAGRIVDQFLHRFGEDGVFYDRDSIRAGKDYRKEIREAVEQSPVFLAVIGPHWLTATDEAGRRRLDLPDDPVRVEVEIALASLSTTVIPVLVDDAEMPAEAQLPEPLRQLHFRNAWTIGERFTRDVSDLADNVDELLHLGPAGRLVTAWHRLTHHKRVAAFLVVAAVAVVAAGMLVFRANSSAPQPRLAWKAELGTRLSSSPASGDGRIFIGTQSTGGASALEDSMVALDAGTGTVQWRFRTGAGVNSSPAFAEGVVYFGSDDGSVYAVSAATGEKQWSALTSGPVQGAPVVVDGLVVVGGDDGRLVAYDATNGQVVWFFNTGGRITTRAAVSGDKVYVGGVSGTLFELPLRGFGEPGSANHELRRWQLAPMFSSPTVADGSLVVGANDTDVHVIRLANGALDVFPSPNKAVAGDAAIFGDLVIVGDDEGVLWAFGLVDLGERWKVDTGPQIVTRPALRGETAYVGSHSGELVGFRLRDGRSFWAFPTGAIIGTDPLIVGDRLFDANDRGTVFAFDLPG